MRGFKKKIKKKEKENTNYPNMLKKQTEWYSTTVHVPSMHKDRGIPRTSEIKRLGEEGGANGRIQSE